jgi:hypothetical protein
MLLLISVSITSSSGDRAQNSEISLIVIKAFEEMGENGYIVSDVPIIITSESDDIDEIYYRIEGGQWINYTEPLTLPGDGNDLLFEWCATDFEGNQSDINGITFDIDTTPPKVDDISWEAWKDVGIWYVDLTAHAWDYTSDMDRVEFFISDKHMETIEGKGPDYVFTIEWKEKWRKHTFWFYHYDRAGNCKKLYFDFPIAPLNIGEKTGNSGKNLVHGKLESLQLTKEIVEHEKTNFYRSISGNFNLSYVVMEIKRKMGNKDWFVSNVTINMVPDPDGIEAIYYKLDDKDWIEYYNSLTISKDGTHEFLWYVVDDTGHSSTPDLFAFKIDQTPPGITLVKKRIAIHKVKFIASVYDKTSNIKNLKKVIVF